MIFLDQPPDDGNTTRPGCVRANWLMPATIGAALNRPPPWGKALDALLDRWIANVRTRQLKPGEFAQMDTESPVTAWSDGSPRLYETFVDRFQREFPKVGLTSFYPGSCPWPGDDAYAASFDAAAYHRAVQARVKEHYWIRKLAAATLAIYPNGDEKWDAQTPTFVHNAFRVLVPFFHERGQKVFFQTMIYRNGPVSGVLAPRDMVRQMCVAADDAGVDGVYGWHCDDEFWDLILPAGSE